MALTDALHKREAVLRAFVCPDGRLVTIPAKHAKRLVVLDRLAQEFEPGERYDEVEVNRRLRAWHDDVGTAPLPGGGGLLHPRERRLLALGRDGSQLTGLR